MKNPFSVPDVPEALGFDEWDEWHKNAKRKFRVRYFISRTLPVFASRTWRQFVHNPWYSIKCRLWHRFNVVYVKTLPPTWMDRDTVLLHAAFQILTDFVEKEKPFDHFDTENSPNKREWVELRALYVWWGKVRPVRIDLLDAIDMAGNKPTREDYSNASEQEDDWDREDDKMLHRLIRIRGIMWT